MRCNDCGKFVGNEENDPEVDNLEVSEDGAVTCSVRIANACDQCSTELKEATFDMESTVDIGEHKGEGHELSVDEDSSERTSRQGYFKHGVFVPKGGRYGKTFYGASVEAKVSCSCGKLDVSCTLMDDIQASAMDEC